MIINIYYIWFYQSWTSKEPKHVSLVLARRPNAASQVRRRIIMCPQARARRTRSKKLADPHMHARIMSSHSPL